MLENDENSATGIWERGLRSGGVLSSGSNNVYATSLNGDYPDLTKSFLISECYDLTQISNPQISFNLAYDLENNWDILYVQYSTDLGQNWQVLGNLDANWYNSDRTPETSGTDCFNCVGAQWTGTNSALTNYFYSLSSLGAETNILFRFVFHSDQSVVGEGVIIDNFLISGVLANQSYDINNLTIYPNPSSGIFNIMTQNSTIEGIEIYDVLGKQIDFNINNQDNTNLVLDLSNASTGIYFVKIKSNNQVVTKKITKK